MPNLLEIRGKDDNRRLFAAYNLECKEPTLRKNRY